MEVNKLNDIYLLFACLNDKVRPRIKRHVAILEKKYSDPTLSKIVKLISSNELITKSDINTILSINSLGSEANKLAIKTFEDSQNMSDATADIIVNKISKMVCYEVLQSAAKLSDPLKAIDKITSYDFNFDNESQVSKFINYDLTLDDINVDEVVMSLGDPIHSSIDEINKSFIIGGYIKHQLIGVVAAPGNGKSLFCMNEAAKFIQEGRKVLYVALGDIGQLDFVTRFSSIILNISQDEASMEAKVSWNRVKNKIGENLKNLRILYIDPGTLTIDQLELYLKGNNPDNRDFFSEYEIIFLDYDTNFLSNSEMYSKGEEIYNKASAWSRIVDLVFLVSQPKTQFFECEVIPQSGLAESSRKAQILDVIIAIGRNQESVNEVGTINIAKVRRGGGKRSFKYHRDVNGVFKSISDNVYNILSKTTKVKTSVTSSFMNIDKDELLKDLDGDS